MSAPRIFTPEYYARMRELEAGGWWNAAMRDVAGHMLARAGLPAAGTMLDVGCGSGQSMLWFERRYPGWRTLGIDIASEGVAAARALGADVSLGSALDIPQPAGSIDAILTLDVLQHLPLPAGDHVALREMRRVLRPGGILYLRTNAQATPRVRDDAVYNYHRYEPAELRAKLRAAGFSVLRLGRVNSLLGLAEIPRELRARRLDRGNEYRGLLAEAEPRPGLGAAVKRGWLGLEGRAVAAGLSLPFGRTIVAICRA